MAYFLLLEEYEMRNIYLEKQLNELINYLIEVIKSISKTIYILNENYLEIREIDKDLEVYVLVVESL